MDKVTFVTVENTDTKELIEHAIIDHGNGEFTTMLKSTYEALKADEPTQS